MNAQERIDQKRADEIFDALDDFGRDQISAWGTAFTTYEDEGENVCQWLSSRARSWRAAKMTLEGK